MELFNKMFRQRMKASFGFVPEGVAPSARAPEQFLVDIGRVTTKEYVVPDDTLIDPTPDPPGMIDHW